MIAEQLSQQKQYDKLKKPCVVKARKLLRKITSSNNLSFFKSKRGNLIETINFCYYANYFNFDPIRLQIIKIC